MKTFSFGAALDGCLCARVEDSCETENNSADQRPGSELWMQVLIEAAGKVKIEKYDPEPDQRHPVENTTYLGPHTDR